jgi:hypothetical protein
MMMMLIMMVIINIIINICQPSFQCCVTYAIKENLINKNKPTKFICPTEGSMDEGRHEYLDKIGLYFHSANCKSINEYIAVATRLLELRVPIPPGARMSLFCECYELLCRGLCVGLITLPETCYRVWAVLNVMGRPRPTTGYSVM